MKYKDLGREELRNKLLMERGRTFKELYLKEIIEKEKPVWETNNLILAPVGSGKSTLIEKELIGTSKGKLIWLVSTSTLKDHVAPPNDKMRKLRASLDRGKRVYTTQNSVKYGEGDYEIHVMTYAEFGRRIFLDNDNELVKDVEKIFCDEIHSLPNYHSYGGNSYLGAALIYLFGRHEDKQIFYFTATEEHLIKLSGKYPNALKHVTRFDYLNHPEIRKFISLSEYKINHISQIRPHLIARKEVFDKRGIKGLAFSRLISSQHEIAKIAEDVGLKPLILWSINNEDHQMNEHQLEMRDIIIRTGLIPEPYNMLVINSAMQEGWDLDDNAVRLAIINTTNETEKIQSLGRIRQDVDVLIYKTYEDIEQKSLVVPEAFLNVYLTADEKRDLCGILNLTDSNGRPMRWTSIKRLLIEDYEIEDKQISIDRKRVRVTMIKEPEK